jgi:hypothetical protein
MVLLPLPHLSLYSSLMFCIAAFIVFGILGIFSATYRPLAGAAWHCTWKRVTFQPCDISFSEEMRGRLLSKLVFRMPRLTKFLDRWLDWIAFAFVALSIWSLLYVANAGLNYWVYGTCNPRNVESCTIGGEACGVDQAGIRLRQAWAEGRLIEWTVDPFVRFGTTVTLIPDRLRTWDAREFLPPTVSFFRPEDPAKPYALEIVDPGCLFCRTLTHNMLNAGLPERANVTYLLYPIPLPEGGYKFPHSLLMASYIEATKRVPLDGGTAIPPGDWQLLEHIFALPADDAIDIQTLINLSFSRAQAEETLHGMLADIGYTPHERERIAELAASEEIADSIAEQRRIAEDSIRTIKIPTLLWNGRRYDRVVSEETLRR